MVLGIGSKLKEAVRRVVPKELGDVASIAALIPGPQQPIAAGLAALGGYREGGFKKAATRGLGAFLGGQFTSGLARGSGFGPEFMQRGFGSGEGSQFLNFLGDPVRGAGESVGGFFAPTETAGLEAVAQQQSIPAAGPDLPADMQSALPRGTPSLPSAAGAIEQKAGATFKQFLNAPVGQKVEIAKQFFNNLSTKQKIGLGIGTATAALTYLENKALENDQLDLTLGPQLGFMGDLRGTNPRFTMAKEGGIIGLANGGEPAMEMDYRGGGFIPVGAKERADDVPARLSKNEFVMTADAVRAAGGGSVDVGAQRMYDLMNRLEAQA
tara:strand:- start:632 stop:1606 length:975 start_codon:yes stop_codon:yes gene_type:complete